MPTHHGMKKFEGLHQLCSPNINRSDRFGRLFLELPGLYIDPRHLDSIGRKSGPMESTGAPKKTSTVPVAHIFFGQFVDHDITLDLTSSFARLDRPEVTPNFRTAQLDLDCIYGDGPEGSPFLYWSGQAAPDDVFNGVKLLTGADEPGGTALGQNDLARSVHGRAIIGDPRNDENRIISQLQLAVIRFNNKVADSLHAKSGLVRGDLYRETRRVVTWHYQWSVVNDFLPTVVGDALLEDIFGSGRKIYRPEDCNFGPAYGAEPYIPVEFSVAAYRFGHSMIPQKLQIQHGKPALDLFGPKLGPGFTPLIDPDAVVHWPQLFDLSTPNDRADKLDSKLAPTLLDLPFVAAGDVKSLATRNLLRGQAFRLPSGEKVAERCGRPAAEISKVTLKAKQLAGSATPPADLAAGTPLWLYVLIEAREIGRETSPGHFDKGEGLGPVGGRIVAETLVGLLELDSASYLGSNRSWSPAYEPDKLGAAGVFNLLDILTF
jgi:hypothetical protein